MEDAGTTILYHPDGFDTGQQKLMGRQAAGEGFLKGWMAHGNANPISVWTSTQAHADHATQFLMNQGWLGKTERCGPDNVAPLKKTGNLFLPGPGLSEDAWKRHWHGDASWSLCGITHTTASHRALDAIAGTLHAPTQAWDALICTSKAVRTTVELVYAGEADWLVHRFGAKKLPHPQLPIIPLGVHCDFFRRDDNVRAKWRAELNISPNAICVLWMGRLSFHAKAHPAPLFRALEKAAVASGKEVCVLLAGWFANDAQKSVFETAAARLAPSIALRFVDARPLEARQAVWSVGDIFTLPSDNIQETFGLAPVEGMAAGLPVVATDWDGFRDTVIDGEHGFLIPTFQPAPGNGNSLAYAAETDIVNYDHYIGAAAQHAGFDIDAAAKAFQTLFEDKALRQKMGEAGQAYVRAHLDWQHIIKRYKELFGELRAIRLAHDVVKTPLWPKVRPTRQDPFALFAGYPSQQITPETWIDVTSSPEDVFKEYQASGNIIWGPSMLSINQIGALHQQSANLGKVQLSAILAKVQPGMHDRSINAIAWLAKHGLVRLTWENAGA